MTEQPAPPAFRFGRYTLSALSERDRPLLEAWIAADPDHRGRVTADFFLKTVPGEDGWRLDDEFGHAVFYLKTATATRLHAQFGPAGTRAERERNREALLEGVEWLAGTLSRNSFREMIFDSFNPLLRRLAVTRMGFTASAEELKRSIPPPSPPESRHGHWRGTPQASGEGAV